jgi:YVTN family beta-propeller protein
MQASRRSGPDAPPSRGASAIGRCARRAALGALAGLALAGCSGVGGGLTDPAGGVGFGARIQPIFERSCLVGCHSSAVRDAGLDLSSWDALIEGSENGEIVIPFHPTRSFLIDHLTGAATPRMPLSRDPLPQSDVDAITRWIGEGARSDEGAVPYETSTRKLYVANQGSDEVSVIDLDALVVFRIVKVGPGPNLGNAHNIWADAPTRRWYVTLIQAGIVEQYDAATDEMIARVRVGGAPANGVMSPDGSRLYVTDFQRLGSRIGAVRVIDAATMTVVDSIAVGGQPHGIALSPDGTRLYTTNYYTDDISVVDLTQSEPVEVARIPIADDVDPLSPEKYQPNEVIVSPDGGTLYVALFKKAELRVLDVEEGTVRAVVPTGGTGFLEALSPSAGEVYVADWGLPGGGGVGRSVTVVSTANLSAPAAILRHDAMSRPHGVAFSPDGKYAFVTNENQDGSGSQHHGSGGPKGNLLVIDTSTRRVVKILVLGPVSAGIAVLD